MSQLPAERYIPKWHQELEIFSRIKNAIILEGNVYDYYPYPFEDNSVTWLNLPLYLHFFFSKLGYCTIIQYNHIDGFSCEDIDQEKRDFQMKTFSAMVRANIADGRITARFSAEPNGAPYIIRDAVMQNRTPTVIILNYTSRYVLPPDRLMQQDQMCFSILQQAIFEARKAPAQNQTRLRNMLVFITDKKNDICYIQINSIYSSF